MRAALLILGWLAVTASARAAQSGGSAPAAAPQSLNASVARSGPALGRLFFTAPERAYLDIARTQKKVAAPTQAAEPVQAAPEPQIVSYGGIVRRSDGKAMLWINNRLVEEKEALAGLNLRGKVRPDGSVTLRVPESGSSIDVKVGQSVELQSGRLAEGRRGQPEAKADNDETTVNAAPQAAGAPGKAPPADTAKKPDAPADAGLKMDLGRRAPRPLDGERAATTK
jgi:hypothetical protein